MAAITASFVPTSDHLRPFDASRDLRPVADLVELCFADTMDAEGQNYLRQMRAAAHNSSFLNWVANAGEPSSLPLTGYVWQVNGIIVGNVSLIPFYTLGKHCYLIANVAVQPAYRGQGIGRALTARAIEHARKRNAPMAWLQVRDDNPSAIHIYQSLGFEECIRRTTWQWESGRHWYDTSLRDASRGEMKAPLTLPPGCNIVSRRKQDWPQQLAWLNRIYPPEHNWNFSLNRTALTPGLWGAFYRFFSLDYPRHWVAQVNGHMAAALTWQRSGGYADILWLAMSASQPPEQQVIEALLHHAQQHLSVYRPANLNFPGGLAAAGIQNAGFRQRQTLIWMSLVTG